MSSRRPSSSLGANWRRFPPAIWRDSGCTASRDGFWPIIAVASHGDDCGPPSSGTRSPRSAWIRSTRPSSARRSGSCPTTTESCSVSSLGKASVIPPSPPSSAARQAPHASGCIGRVNASPGRSAQRGGLPCSRRSPGRVRGPLGRSDAARRCHRHRRHRHRRDARRAPPSSSSGSRGHGRLRGRHGRRRCRHAHLPWFGAYRPPDHPGVQRRTGDASGRRGRSEPARSPPARRPVRPCEVRRGHELCRLLRQGRPAHGGKTSEDHSRAVAFG